jgi:hypothetical protein
MKYPWRRCFSQWSSFPNGPEGDMTERQLPFLYEISIYWSMTKWFGNPLHPALSLSPNIPFPLHAQLISVSRGKDRCQKTKQQLTEIIALFIESKPGAGDRRPMKLCTQNCADSCYVFHLKLSKNKLNMLSQCAIKLSKIILKSIG